MLEQSLKNANLNLQSSVTSSDNWAQRQADAYNNEVGTMKYYDCPKCKNKGTIAVVVDDEMLMHHCSCKPIRMSKRLLAESGINEDYTLETYVAKDEWQKKVLAAAKNFLFNPQGWFYIGGQVGGGKTHICTGIVRGLIDIGNEARYMLWRDDSTKIKASVNYPEDYASLVEPLKTVKVLYIDDFWKTNSGEPTTADVNLAFEILNARYNRKDLITIISSEYYSNELMDVDEAVGSRIYERASGNRHNIKRDRQRNYRLRGDELL